MKGIFGKLFEEIPTEDDVDVMAGLEYTYTPPIAEVEIQDVRNETLVEDIYSKNDLSDKEGSIFKVEELMAALPQTMATETKKATVKGTLNIFNLTIAEVIDDAKRRVEILDAAIRKILEEGNDSISRKESRIEEYKKEIEVLEEEIAKEKEELKFSEDVITSELKRVTGLIDFIWEG